jgi:histidinol phosphatase-like PHP family hydrolase
MAGRGKADYHVHYHLDRCSSDEMTLANIAATALEAGLEDICVVKHYTDRLPNGQAQWVYWKRIAGEQFEQFLADHEAFDPPEGLRVLRGVESELVSEDGTIAIPAADQRRIDAVVLSCHWLPELDCLTDEARSLRVQVNPYAESPERDHLAAVLNDIGPEAIVRGLARAYANACDANPTVRVLAHMADGLDTVRRYGVDVDGLGEERLVELMAPVVAAAVAGNVLWELTHAEVVCPAILTAANDAGVRFCATADAHQLTDGWAPLTRHDAAETNIDALGLTRGAIALV